MEFREPEAPGYDRRHARLDAGDRWAEIADHYETDPDDALDLHGTRLSCYAVRRGSVNWEKQGR
ncbi:hypothetical protein ACFYQ5_12530 [Streptomyces sp. NPDC005794]|uniref:hypothetical protein n=1 Tax=Streptomyces sp. NPDC005794 TaxID=3364733 RepID=UPI0036817280